MKQLNKGQASFKVNIVNVEVKYDNFPEAGSFGG